MGKTLDIMLLKQPITVLSIDNIYNSSIYTFHVTDNQDVIAHDAENLVN